MATKTVSVPLFDVHLTLIDSTQDAEAFVREHSAEHVIMDELLKCRGFYMPVTDAQGKEHRMLCVFDKETTMDTAVHESVHAAWAILRHCSVRVKPISDEEPLAYLTAWIACATLRFLASQKDLTPPETTA